MAFGPAVAAGFTDRILTLPAWLVLALVFLLPALEASAFVGFVFPGEVAVILVGVAASRGTVPLWAVIAAAVAGAVIGDSAGYLIGRRWGERLLAGTIGRLPVIRRHLNRHLESARGYVLRRRGSAVFFGRFTAALRVLVPGLAGMSRVEYPVFLACNVAGGALWGTGMAVLGYLAGASYQHAEKIAGRAGLGLLALIVLGLVISRLARRLAGRPRLRAIGGRLAATPLLAWIRRRFPRQLAWAGRRLAARDPRGFWLTFTVAAGALAAWAFGAITQDVVAREETALRDPHIAAWVAAHRTGWLTAAAKAVTWLGSDIVLIPLLVLAAAVLVAARRDWRSAIRLALALSGAAASSGIAQVLVGRSRPPAAMRIGHYSGLAFPSGHAAQALAFYGMLAIILAAGRPARARALLWAAAAAVTVVAGGSGLYLGANWLTDVLGGYALGAMWIALVLTVHLLTSRDGRPQTTTPRTPMNTRPATRQETEPGAGAGARWHRRRRSLRRMTAVSRFSATSRRFVANWRSPTRREYRCRAQACHALRSSRPGPFPRLRQWSRAGFARLISAACPSATGSMTGHSTPLDRPRS
jgi:membrane protein DedA with SNARE-associated domain/membrane-associated phospholipid phosphatase